MLMTGVILVAKPNKLFQVSHLRTESNENLTTYFTGLCLALIAAFCGALIGITTKVLKGKQQIVLKFNLRKGDLIRLIQVLLLLFLLFTLFIYFNIGL